jgi:2-amino-4-hydroxy-6-hydroxymethyldihydropteridine diphosphokinase
MTIVYIGLGSNLDDPVAHIGTALDDISSLPEIKLLAKSSLYRGPPLGPEDQPDFINAVVKLETTLPANILLGCLQEIEQQHGRQRNKRWGPRTLDLDILLYGDMKITDEALTIPHPEMMSRNFVLFPLMEIDEALEVPEHGMIRDLFLQLNVDPPEKI